MLTVKKIIIYDSENMVLKWKEFLSFKSNFENSFASKVPP
jgi:hypothetical protein